MPQIVRESLEQLAPEDAAEAEEIYREATEEERAGIVAFLEGGGPELFRQLHLEHEEGVPASDELGRWAGESD